LLQFGGKAGNKAKSKRQGIYSIFEERCKLRYLLLPEMVPIWIAENGPLFHLPKKDILIGKG
jgi:hypothetical protein